MDIVVDANVIMSCLISPKNKTSELFFSGAFHLLAPEYLKREIEKHKEEIAEKSGLDSTDLNLSFAMLCSKVAFIQFSDFERFISEAARICPDPNDAEYFALALKFGCPVWSNDKKLKGQKEVKVLSTSELLTLF